jgi:hypothetical protein
MRNSTVFALICFMCNLTSHAQSFLNEVVEKNTFRVSVEFGGYASLVPGMAYGPDYGSEAYPIFTLGLKTEASISPVHNPLIQNRWFIGGGLSTLFIQHEHHVHLGQELFLGYKHVFAGFEYSWIPVRRAEYFDGDPSYIGSADRAISHWRNHTRIGGALRFVDNQDNSYDIGLNTERFLSSNGTESDFLLLKLAICKPGGWRLWTEFSWNAPLIYDQMGLGQGNTAEHIPLYLQIGFSKHLQYKQALRF